MGQLLVCCALDCSRAMGQLLASCDLYALNSSETGPISPTATTVYLLRLLTRYVFMVGIGLVNIPYLRQMAAASCCDCHVCHSLCKQIQIVS